MRVGVIYASANMAHVEFSSRNVFTIRVHKKPALFLGLPSAFVNCDIFAAFCMPWARRDASPACLFGCFVHFLSPDKKSRHGKRTDPCTMHGRVTFEYTAREMCAMQGGACCLSGFRFRLGGVEEGFDLVNLDLCHGAAGLAPAENASATIGVAVKCRISRWRISAQKARRSPCGETRRKVPRPPCGSISAQTVPRTASQGLAESMYPLRSPKS